MIDPGKDAGVEVAIEKLAVLEPHCERGKMPLVHWDNRAVKGCKLTQDGDGENGQADPTGGVARAIVEHTGCV